MQRNNSQQQLEDTAVSVVVLCVNAASELRDAVRSLVRQQPKPEIIVVNSGGGDAGKVLGELTSQVKLVSFEKLLWPGAARNVGIKLASKTIIAFLAADCLAGENWVALRQISHKMGVDVVANPVINQFKRNPVAFASHLAVYSSRLPMLPKEKASLYGGSFHRKLFKEYGYFREDLRIGEDTEFMERINKEAIVEWVPDLLTMHRSPRTPISALVDNYKRGLRFGYFWGRRRRGRFFRRWYNRTRIIIPSLNAGLGGVERLWALCLVPFIILLIGAYEAGVRWVGRLETKIEKASQQGLFSQELRYQQYVWKKTGSELAAKRIVELLDTLECNEEVTSFLKNLDKGTYPERISLLVKVHYMTLCHNWLGIVSLLEYQNLIRYDVTLLTNYVQAAILLGFSDKASLAISAYRGLQIIQVALLDVQIKLLTGDLRGALKAYDTIAIDVQPKIPKHLVGALVNAAVCIRGKGQAEQLLRSFDINADLLVLKGHQILYQYRLQSIGFIQAQKPLAFTSMLIEKEILEVLIREKIDRPELSNVIRQYGLFRSKAKLFVPDCSLLISEAITVARCIIKVIREQKPFCLIRLGDGEGNLLPYRSEWKAFCKTDFRLTRRAWWGATFSNETEYEKLQVDLKRAIAVADVIGIPDILRFTLAPQTINKNSRGLLAVYDHLENKIKEDPEWFNTRIITTCHIHQSLAYWGLWDILIPEMKEVSVITCHKSLVRVLKKKYGVKVCRQFLLPEEAKYSDTFGYDIETAHFPDLFNHLCRILESWEPTGVVLVAAGVLGKTYCKLIRDNGGIALDIGSFADQLCGFKTRSLEEVTMFYGPSFDKDYLKFLVL